MGHPDDADEVRDPIPGVAGEDVMGPGPYDLVAAASGRVDLDKTTTEQLLAGHAGPPELMRLLSQAAAPARPDELAGEAAAMAAFRAARAAARTPARATAHTRAGVAARSPAGAAAPSPALAHPRSSAPSRRSVTVGHTRRPWARPRLWARPQLWARLASVKAGVLVAALTAGGAALATGALWYPGPHPSRVDSPSSGTGTPSSAVLTSMPGPVAEPSGSGRPGGSAPPTGPGETPGADSLAGLCHAYLAQVGGHPGRELLNHPSFAHLVEAAGGPDRVDAYCQRLLMLTGPSVSGGAASSPTSGPGPASGSAGNTPGSGNATSPANGTDPGNATANVTGTGNITSPGNQPRLSIDDL